MLRTYLYALSLSLFAMSAVAQAQIIVIESPAETKESPTPEDYEKALGHFKKVADKTFNRDTWKDVKLTHRETKVEKKFTEFSTTEQVLIMLNAAEKQTLLMKNLGGAWDSEVKAFDSPAHKLVPRAVIGNQKQNPAVKGDVEEYCKQLHGIRKNYAVAYEKFAEKFLADAKDVDDKEKKFTLDAIRSMHDELKLIERAKK